MEFNEVLEKRRTYRDYTNREVSDEIVKQVISAAFKAPTNDHLRQLEFVVVRGRENIAKVIDPLAKNMAAFKNLVHEVDESGDKDKMVVCRCPTQTTAYADAERFAHHPVLPAKDVATAETGGTKLAELLRFSLVCRGEYAPCSNE